MSELGFKGTGRENEDNDNIFVLSDDEACIQLIGGKGAILVSGTGSICYGINGERSFCAGGLGYDQDDVSNFIGNEGSGFWIGLKGVQACLENELGWGRATTLTRELEGHFPFISSINDLI